MTSIDHTYIVALIAIFAVGMTLAFFLGRRFERNRFRKLSLFGIAQSNAIAHRKRWATGPSPQQHQPPPPAFRTHRPLFRSPHA